MSTATWPQGAAASHDAAPKLFDAAGADDCVDVLVNRRCSLLLCSDDGPLLDRQAQMLMRSLRDVADIETAVLLEMDRGLLLDRFNRLLAEFTLEQARQRVPTVIRVWILHVHSAAETSQARLLLRLCQDFPAAGVALALLGPVSVGRELAPEGSTRRLHVRVLTDFWSEMSRAAGPSARTDPPLGPPPEEAPAAVAAPAPPPPTQVLPARMRLPARAPWIGLGLLVACAGAVVWVQSRPGVDLLRGPSQGAQADILAAQPAVAPATPRTDPALQPLPAQASAAGPALGGAVNAEVSAPAPAAAAGLDARNATSAAIALPPGAGGPAVVASVAPAAVLVSAPIAVAASPAPMAAVPQVPVTATSDRPQAQTGKALPPAPPPAPATPGDQIASTVRWAQSQSASGWIVQHGIDNDVGRLLELRRSFPRLDESRVLALVRTDGRLYYALVSGPFESADGARNFIKDGADIPSLPWVRSIASLLRELDERRGRVVGATAVN